MKSALFVQANVAVNTKLTSVVPFLFGNFQVYKKRAISVWYDWKNFLLPPVANISWKIFLGALFNALKCPQKQVPPPKSFDASYTPADIDYSLTLLWGLGIVLQLKGFIIIRWFGIHYCCPRSCFIECLSPCIHNTCVLTEKYSVLLPSILIISPCSIIKLQNINN